jgi:hypothetical protein
MVAVSGLLAAPAEIGEIKYFPAGLPTVLTFGSRTYLRTGVSALASAYPALGSAFTSLGFTDNLTSAGIAPYCADTYTAGNYLGLTVGGGTPSYTNPPYYSDLTTNTASGTSLSPMGVFDIASGNGVAIACGYDSSNPGSYSSAYAAGSGVCWRSTNGGAAFSSVTLPLTAVGIGIVYAGNNAGADTWIMLCRADNDNGGTAFNGVLRSVNGGTTFVNKTFTSTYDWYRIYTDGAGVVIATRHQSTTAWRSTDFGNTWASITLPAIFDWMCVSGGTWIGASNTAGAGGTLYKSTNNWISNSAVTLPSGYTKVSSGIVANGYFVVQMVSGPVWWTSDASTWLGGSLAFPTSQGSMQNGNYIPVNGGAMIYWQPAGRAVWTGSKVAFSATLKAATPKNFILNAQLAYTGPLPANGVPLDVGYLRVA